MSKTKCYCSFCGKSNEEVFQLIAGVTCFICNECVGLCVEIIAKKRAEVTKSLLEAGY